jgi:hypothetical protein
MKEGAPIIWVQFFSYPAMLSCFKSPVRDASNAQLISLVLISHPQQTPKRDDATTTKKAKKQAFATMPRKKPRETGITNQKLDPL